MSISVDIEKNLGSFHLRVAFEAENETMALLGASGCGKSMTLRCIAGIVRPDRGRIMLNGRTLFDSEQHIDLPPQQRGVGYLFQQYALFPHMTVEKNVCAGTREGTRTERKAAAQRGLSCGRPLARNIFFTASPSSAFAARPYTVSVGMPTTSP